MTHGQALTLWLAPAGAHHAVVRWNGAQVADVELADWTPVVLDVTDLGLHTNELTIEAPGAYALIEHDRHTTGELELTLDGGVRCLATCFTPGVA